MNKYEFVIYQKGTSHIIALWDCYEEKLEDAIQRFIRHLKDICAYICEDDDEEYEKNIYAAIQKKLTEKEYEVVINRYIAIGFTLEELDNM